MRISDWSSDVCSSDLTLGVDPIAIGGERDRAADAADQAKGVDYRTVWKARNEPAQCFPQVWRDEDGEADHHDKHDAAEQLHRRFEDQIGREQRSERGCLDG